MSEQLPVCEFHCPLCGVAKQGAQTTPEYVDVLRRRGAPVADRLKKVWWCTADRQIYKRDVENVCHESHKRRKCGWYFLIPLSAPKPERELK